MDVYTIDPLQDARWPDFIARHPQASVFHTRAWLRALHQTYRFVPIAFTTSPATADLRNALVFCVVRSWLTGERLVSVSFADHCEPLVDDDDELRVLCAAVLRRRSDARWRYIEIRPVSARPWIENGLAAVGFRPTHRYYRHYIDLRPDLDGLFRSFHKDSIQRKIRRAEREGLTHEVGRSEALIGKLWYLLDATRRRHQVPLQPLAWFRNLMAAFGERLAIHITSKAGRPAAGLLTLMHGDTMVYKYGGSRRDLHPLGGMPFLLWKTIEEAKELGASELDLGRSDLAARGLVRFKEQWAAKRSPLTYWRSPAPRSPSVNQGGETRLARRVLAALPGPIRRLVGSRLYRHYG